VAFLRRYPEVNLTVRGKNLDVPPVLREYAEKKIGKFDKFFDSDLSAQVTVGKEKEHYIVEVTMPLDGGILVRGEEQALDLFSAVDEVVDKMTKQIDRYRARFQKKGLSSVRSGVETAQVSEPKVVRTKHIAIKPMAVDEAIMQMNLLGHDFFLFRNSDTEQTALVYKRKDGNYGLIEPED